MAFMSARPWLASSARTRLGSVLPLAALWLGACGGTPRQVESVARADLGCEQLSIEEIAKNRYAASGCGKGGVYAQLCGDAEGCQWVRLRGAEPQLAATSGGVSMPQQPPQQREIIQAPPPAPREIIQAPPPAPPAQRQIIPAPPPDTQAPSAAPAAPGAPTSAAPLDARTQQAYGAQQTPLTQGELSQPYQTDVPLQPTAQQVQYPPPEPLPEDRPPPPAPNYQWVGGYWSWGNSNWLWAPGYWTPPMYGYSYVPGSWYWANNYWWYGPGGWARPNSTYIAYGPGARPYRHAYTRSFTPHHATPAYPGRIGAGPAHPQSVAHAPGNGFQPQGSPLYRYPSSLSSPVTRSSGVSHMPSNHTSYGQMQPSMSGPSRFGSAPTHSEFRSAPMQRMQSAPSYSAPPQRSPSMTRMGGGGGGGFSGGGGPSRMGAGPMHGGGRR